MGGAADQDGEADGGGEEDGDAVRKQFTGYEFDDEIDLDMTPERVYARSIGRFLSTDPILISELRVFNPQIWNSYSYVGNNPLNFSDPSGMERIQLGQSETDIQKDIAEQKKTKESLRKQRDALKKEKKTLSKEEYKQRETQLKNEERQAENAIKTLGTKLEGTRMVNSMLSELKSKGEGNGLNLTDFSISTDPKADFPGAKFPVAIGDVTAFVVQKADGTGPAYGGQIFINAKGPLWDGALNGREGGTSRDWIRYGASVLRHEQWHRDAPTGRSSERLAYQTQLPILKKFEHDIGRSFYNQQIKKVMQRGR